MSWTVSRKKSEENGTIQIKIFFSNWACFFPKKKMQSNIEKWHCQTLSVHSTSLKYVPLLGSQAVAVHQYYVHRDLKVDSYRNSDP